MPNLPMSFDPLSMTRMGIATWLTDWIVAQKFGEAMWRQNALMMATLQPAAHARSAH